LNSLLLSSFIFSFFFLKWEAPPPPPKCSCYVGLFGSFSCFTQH
jgi:hypothetical protein